MNAGFLGNYEMAWRVLVFDPANEYVRARWMTGVGSCSRPVNCCRDKRCFPLKSMLGKLAALKHAVPLSALTYDPLVVT